MTKTYSDTSTYHYYNANPKNRLTGDCVIRAISSATGKSWDEVLDGLVDISHTTKYDPFTPECYGRYLEKNGFTRMKQPRKWDNSKYTGDEFCDYLDDKCIKAVVAHIGFHHTVCFKPDNGPVKVWDTWPSSDRCVGVYWIKYR